MHSIPQGDHIERRVAFEVFTKLCIFDHRHSNRFAVDFRVDGFHAGRAIQSCQCAEYQRQCFPRTRQATGSPSLDLNHVGQFELFDRVQVQRKGAIRRPA